MARIAFLLPDFEIGGAERVVLELIKDFAKRGFEIDLVLMRREGELISQLPGTVKIVSLNVKRFRAALVPFLGYLRNQKPAVVQVRMWPLTLVAVGAKLLLRSRARIVVSDDNVLSKAYHSRGRLHRMFLRTSIALLYPHADARVAVSEGVADDLARLGGLDRTSITVLHNPVAFTPLQNGLRSVDWGGDGVRVLAVGNLIPVKNYSLLISSFARFTRSRPARLIVLGDGEEREALEKLAIDLGIRDRVALPGFIDDPAPYYRSANMLVVSSRNEGFGNVLVEAMHHGLNVVSTNCPVGPREILAGGQYGYLAPCDDPEALALAMVNACDQPFPADMLIRRAEELSGPHVLEAYLTLLLPNLAIRSRGHVA